MAMISDHLPSFGSLLKDFRTRRRLTQHQLAVAVGVHRNAVGRWEQGDFLPATKGMVLELARHLALDESQARQFLEASLTALSPHWGVPLLRNPYFTGREEILEALHRRLHEEQAVARTQAYALKGLGGMGKTQIALEYAYQHALDYSGVFWIGAETEAQVVSSLLRIAELLQVPERHAPEPQHVVAAVHRWLTTHSQWLLIWDNLDDLDLLARYLPPARGGAILLTTRAQALGTLARGLALLPMESEEGRLFLLRRAKVLEPDATSVQVRHFAARLPGEYAAATELVEVLGGLPLALDQAGAYIEETGCGLADYLQSYGTQRSHFLARRGIPGGDHPDSVAATFRLVWQRVQREHPPAAEVLRVCAFLAAEAIPEELFLADCTSSADAAHASAALDLALASLRTCSLVQRHPATRTFALHRLVQAVLQEAMRKPEHVRVQRRAVHLLNAAFPDVPPGLRIETWGPCERLLPHVLTCTATLPAHVQDQALAQLLLKAAGYLLERSAHQQAERLGQRALQCFEATLGPQHPQVAVALYLLARLARQQGQYVQAEQRFQQAASLLEQALGSEHPRVAALLHSLAITYSQQGKYELAEPLYQRALRLREQAFGPEHPEVATSLNTLGILARELGNYEQAEQYYQRALRIWEQAFGPEHPQVALTLNNLANLYREWGRYALAEPLCQRALSLLEQAMGLEHPDAAIPLDTLATVYREQGRYQQAALLYQRARCLLEQRLGAEHPRVVSPLTGQALLATAVGQYPEAEALYARALRIQQQALGPAHPETARLLAGLARLYVVWGRDEQAEPLLCQACAILEARLGPAHPETVKTAHDYQRLLERTRPVLPTHTEEAPAPPTPGPRRARQLGAPQRRPAEGRAAPLRAEDDPLAAFLISCCEQHPRAWCRSADLWQAYASWAATHQERFPLARRAFLAQLKAHGCRPDRTKTARIWRGIALVQQRTMTQGDGG